MRWRGRRQSTNIEDRRGRRGTSGGRRRGGGGMKIGGAGLAVMALLFLLTGQGGNIMDMLGGGGMGGLTGGAPQSTQITQQQQAPASGKVDEGREFVAVVLRDTEEGWNPIFKQAGGVYREPSLVLYERQTSSGCGPGSSAMGPFYCPADQKMYIDLSFYNQMQQMGASGDFAFAYVIAHEVGHHVQKLEGTSDKIMRMQRQTSKVKANQLSVLLELQADCYAGIWANRQARFKLLEDGDLEEAINAASVIGDDHMQRNAGQRVDPRGFTHGSSRQRMEWLKRGMRGGNPADCNTFAAVQ